MSQRPFSPQQWIACALLGFFRHEGRTLTPAQKGALAAQMALAACGIAGECDIAEFQAMVLGTAEPPCAPRP